MTLASKSLTSLLDDFRSSAPTPGGGSAAALAGALGASLFTMVASLPKPQATTAADLDRLRSLGERTTAAAKELEALIDRDAEAYESVMRAYRLPKGSENEKATRLAQIQEALKAAVETPLAVMRACAAGAAQGPALLQLGNPNASSDVGVGLELLRAGLRGAQLNIEINLTSIKDQHYADAVRREVERLVNESGAADAPSASA
jgi:formiminotetrahydrofolate cyclodeaminase